MPSSDVARWLRAVRRARGLSQRELAASAGVPRSSVAAIESGSRVPGLAVLEQILTAHGFRLALIDDRAGATGVIGGAVEPDDAHDAARDRAGRRLPAHLEWGPKPDITSAEAWWGWLRGSWNRQPPQVPDHAFWQRPRPDRPGPWRDHPWWGPYQARVDRVDPSDAVGQSRPSEGPPELPPA